LDYSNDSQTDVIYSKMPNIQEQCITPPESEDDLSTETGNSMVSSNCSLDFNQNEEAFEKAVIINSYAEESERVAKESLNPAEDLLEPNTEYSHFIHSAADEYLITGIYISYY
jgi:hypothetical protein